MTQETIIKNMLTDTSQSQKKRARTEQIQKKLLGINTKQRSRHEKRNRGDDTKTPINK